MAQVPSFRANTGPPPADLLCVQPPLPRAGCVLVVEDRDDVRTGIAQLLELHGFRAIEVASGEQAVAAFDADGDAVALVLLDLLLPGTLSGRDVRAHQLARPGLAAIPMVVVTSCEQSPSGLAELRPAAWLEKPFRFEALLALVKQYVTPVRDGVARFG